MTVYDLIVMNRSNMEALMEHSIRLEDVERIALYEEYVSMVKIGLKISYILSVLAEKYRISERQVLRIVQKFRKKIE